MNAAKDELKEIFDELFYQGYYEGREDEYAKGHAVSVHIALEQTWQWHQQQLLAVLSQVEKDMNEKLDKSYADSGKGSRPKFSKETETKGEYYSRSQGFKSGMLVAKRHFKAAIERVKGLSND